MRYLSNVNWKAWNRISRIWLAVVFLPLICVLFTACDINCNGINNCNSGGSGTPTGGNPTGQGISIQYQDLGTWTYWHEDGSYPQPPPDGVIVAYGDIQNDGNCHIKMFFSGDTVANLGNGTFELVELTGGDSNAFLQYVKDTIQPPLQSANISCPII
ncbi:MAG TPA: hypothetical protein VKU38_17045 [Ktedonobacteraceae bacterium]|nr:hypothetical protein [Ktedonobacteraceae bacterium]